MSPGLSLWLVWRCCRRPWSIRYHDVHNMISMSLVRSLHLHVSGSAAPHFSFGGLFIPAPADRTILYCIVLTISQLLYSTLDGSCIFQRFSVVTKRKWQPFKDIHDKWARYEGVVLLMGAHKSLFIHKGGVCVCPVCHVRSKAQTGARSKLGKEECA